MRVLTSEALHLVKGVDISHMTEAQQAAIRRRRIWRPEKMPSAPGTYPKIGITRSGKAVHLSLHTNPANYVPKFHGPNQNFVKTHDHFDHEDHADAQKIHQHYARWSLGSAADYHVKMAQAHGHMAEVEHPDWDPDYPVRNQHVAPAVKASAAGGGHPAALANFAGVKKHPSLGGGGLSKGCPDHKPFHIHTGEGGDFHIHKYGNNAGKPTDKPGPNTYAVHANPDLFDHRYLKYAFEHAHGMGKFKARLRGTAQQFITTKDAHDVMEGHFQELGQQRAENEAQRAEREKQERWARQGRDKAGTKYYKALTPEARDLLKAKIMHEPWQAKTDVEHEQASRQRSDQMLRDFFSGGGKTKPQQASHHHHYYEDHDDRHEWLRHHSSLVSSGGAKEIARHHDGLFRDHLRLAGKAGSDMQYHDAAPQAQALHAYHHHVATAHEWAGEFGRRVWAGTPQSDLDHAHSKMDASYQVAASYRSAAQQHHQENPNWHKVDVGGRPMPLVNSPFGKSDTTKALTKEAHDLVKAKIMHAPWQQKTETEHDEAMRSRSDQSLRDFFSGGSTAKKPVSLPTGGEHHFYEKHPGYSEWFQHHARLGRLSNSLVEHQDRMAEAHGDLGEKADDEDKLSLRKYHRGLRSAHYSAANAAIYGDPASIYYSADKENEELRAARGHYDTAMEHHAEALKHHRENPDWHKTNDLGDTVYPAQQAFHTRDLKQKSLTKEAHDLVKAKIMFEPWQQKTETEHDEAMRSRSDRALSYVFGSGGTPKRAETGVHHFYDKHADAQAWAKHHAGVLGLGKDEHTDAHAQHHAKLAEAHWALMRKANFEGHIALGVYHDSMGAAHHKQGEFHSAGMAGDPGARHSAQRNAQVEFNQAQKYHASAQKYHAKNPDWHKTDRKGQPISVAGEDFAKALTKEAHDLVKAKIMHEPWQAKTDVEHEESSRKRSDQALRDFFSGAGKMEPRQQQQAEHADPYKEHGSWEAWVRHHADKVRANGDHEHPAFYTTAHGDHHQDQGWYHRRLKLKAVKEKVAARHAGDKKRESLYGRMELYHGHMGKAHEGIDNAIDAFHHQASRPEMDGEFLYSRDNLAVAKKYLRGAQEHHQSNPDWHKADGTGTKLAWRGPDKS